MRVQRLIMIITLLSLSSLACASRQLTTYTVQYADPMQIQAVLKGYLSPESSVSVYQNRLIVNATSSERETIQSLLKQLDVAGRQLLISVRTGGEGSSTYSEAGTSAPIRVETGHGVSTRTTTTVTIRNQQRQGSAEASQGVRATEGQPTYVTTGVSAPVVTTRATADGSIVRSQQYVNADTGFYATAWVNDDRVRLQIAQQRENFQGDNIQSQQLQTDINGKLGQWIAVGMIADSGRSIGKGILYKNAAQSDTQQTIYVKVELLE